MKLGVIGCGNMATAIVSGCIKNRLFNKISIYDKNEKQIKNFSKLFNNIDICQNPQDVLKKSEYILISVKPQNFKELFENISECITKKHILISIAAGISIDKIYVFATKKNIKVARIMPNTPAMICKGMSGITFNKNVTRDEKIKVIKIFESFGRIVKVNESRMNSITAISGSGPAYIFLFAELMIKAAIDLGFKEKEAETLVFQTFSGSVEMMISSKLKPEMLRRNVTSPKGTTEAAINFMFESKIDEIIKKAILKAKERADELGK